MLKMKKRLLVFVIAFLLSCGLFACGNDAYIADNTEHYDEITKTLKLNKTYEGKSFILDGIGKATVDAYTDGDTTRYKLSQGDVISVRSYQIDTPESTTNVDKWGKAASMFAKSKLEKATEIVLEATGPRATKDSYGTRYLGYIWYKTADYNEFKCLNLELVENGFSDNTGVDTNDFPYYEYFRKANNFAKSIQLRLYSKLDDPLYSTDPIEMTLKEFYNNIEKYYDAENEAGAKVKLIATLTSLYKSKSGTYTYTASEYDPETKKTYTINVYAGYDSSPSSSMRIGHLYEVIGNVQEWYGNYQISGIEYDTIYSLEGFTKVLQKNYYLAFDSEVAYTSQYKDTLYGNVTVVSTSLKDNILTIVGKAYQKIEEGYKEDAVTYTFTVEVDDKYQNEITENTKFSVYGYQFVKESKEISILNYSDIKIK